MKNMNSTYTGIYIASRGLYSSQAGLAVTSNNMSNANTTDYSRQTVNQTTLNVAAVYDGHAILGNGSQVTSVDRTRDARLDQRYWQENTRLGEWSSKSDTLTEIESVLDPTSSSSGFSTVFDNFYSSLESLAKDPSSSSARATMKEDGVAVCQYLNETSQKLTEIRSNLNNSVKTTTDQINSYAEQIANLNDRITQADLVGANTNDLKDQRTVLLDQLSALADITVTDNGKLSVSMNGTFLVNGGEARQLEVVQDSANDNLYTVQWKDTGDAVKVTGGQLKSELDLRDGDGTASSYKGIPYYINQLNKFARTFAEGFNEGVLAGETTATYSGHASGETANNTTGIRFFSYNSTSSADISAQITANGLDATYQKITAANITLSSDVVNDVSNIAAASSSGGSDNSDNVNELIKLLKDDDLFNKGTAEDFYNSIISTLGSDSSTAQRRDDNATSMVKTINDRRTSISGVDTNEETASMTKYEMAYEASSKMISVWGEVFAKTIDMVNS